MITSADGIRVRLIRHTSDSTVREAVAICHAKVPKASENRVRGCIEQGHTSVLEHWVASLELRGISRNVLQQIARYRLLSITVESGRAVDMSERSGIYPPEAFGAGTTPTADQEMDAMMLMQEAYDTARQFYQSLRQLGVSREAARYVLPEGMETAIIVTGNAREWRHFLQERLAPGAMPEMRLLAGVIALLLTDASPLLFQDIQIPEIIHQAAEQLAARGGRDGEA